MFGAVTVCFRDQRILTDDVERSHLTALHRVEHFVEAPPALARDLHAPRSFEFSTQRIVAYALESRKTIGDSAHVSAALHIVLTAQRVQSAAKSSNVAGEQREVDEREDVVDCVVVLGDAKRPTNHSAVGRRIGARRLTDDVGWYAGYFFGPFRRRVLNRSSILFKACCCAIDEHAVLETLFEYLVSHRVGELDVGSDIESKPSVSPLRRNRTARIYNDQVRAIAHALENVMEEDRVRFARVR